MTVARRPVILPLIPAGSPDEPLTSLFTDRPPMRRCIVFAHYDRDQLVDDHVRFLLRQLRPFAEKVIFISVSASTPELETLADCCDIALTRENIGYDFMSWKTGLQHLEDPAQYDEILFVNDSIYGPLFDLGPLIQRSEHLDTDFWGLTRCYEIQPHIQSFFFAFRKSLLDNGLFSAFWDSVVPLEDKKDIIRRYEIGMTAFLEERGARCSSLFDQFTLGFSERLMAARANGVRKGKSTFSSTLKYLRGRVSNPMHLYWRNVIEHGVPFLKVELLRDNPRGLPETQIYDFLEHSDYSSALIGHHLDRVKR